MGIKVTKIRGNRYSVLCPSGIVVVTYSQLMQALAAIVRTKGVSK